MRVKDSSQITTHSPVIGRCQKLVKSLNLRQRTPEKKHRILKSESFLKLVISYFLVEDSLASNQTGHYKYWLIIIINLTPYGSVL